MKWILWSLFFLFLLQLDLVALSQNIKPSDFDVVEYDLEVKVDPDLRRIAGTSKITIIANERLRGIELNLSQALAVSRISLGKTKLAFSHENASLSVVLPKTIMPGEKIQLSILFGGAPKQLSADHFNSSGFLWSLDHAGNPWVEAITKAYSTDSWWPCITNRFDEVNKIIFSAILPKELGMVANGVLKEQVELPGNFICHKWEMAYSMTPDQLAFAVGNFRLIRDVYQPRKGDPTYLHAISLSGNEQKAERLLRYTKRILAVLEQRLGPYPFWNLGLKLLDLPLKGVSFPAIIPFPASSRTETDELTLSLASQWVSHKIILEESEDEWLLDALEATVATLYLEGAENSQFNFSYWINQTIPEISSHTSSLENPPTNKPDIVYGLMVLNGIRQELPNDAAWHSLLIRAINHLSSKGFSNSKFINFLYGEVPRSLFPYIDQYIRLKRLPTLEYTLRESARGLVLRYRWADCVDEFQMPFRYWVKGKASIQKASGMWNETTLARTRSGDFSLEQLPKLYLTSSITN